MKLMLLPPLLLLASLAAAEKPYDFRTSAAYAKLSSADQHKLEQVHHHQVLLWGALDMFADQHNGNPPSSLDELVPRYLAELPSDPFATQQTAGAQVLQGYTPSKGGVGYQFRRGACGNRFPGQTIERKVQVHFISQVASVPNRQAEVCTFLSFYGLTPSPRCFSMPSPGLQPGLV